MERKTCILFLITNLLVFTNGESNSTNASSDDAKPEITNNFIKPFNMEHHINEHDKLLLDDLQKRTFRYFWDLADKKTGLIPDRHPTPSSSSITAVGFGLTVYVVGVERGYVTRAEARDRVYLTLKFLLDLPQGPQQFGTSGYKGFFYHFLDMKTGHRFANVELSTVDTALFIPGALVCQTYFNNVHDAKEKAIGEIAEKLYQRIDWNWAQPRPPLITHGWYPESGFIPWDWGGYNEAMIVYILALGSPTFPVKKRAWDGWAKQYRWQKYYGQEYTLFGPLFGHQYSHLWVDFKGIQDDFMRGKGIDYYENSRRAVFSHQNYAITNPGKWKSYGEDIWGLTACDGPLSITLSVNGSSRTFKDYWARGVDPHALKDDGTISPTAAAGSIPFAPEIALPAIRKMKETYGNNLYSDMGFRYSFNPTFDVKEVTPQHGNVVPGIGWFASDYLGIDQGSIVIMIENYRTQLIWKIMKNNRHIVRGLRKAGFKGGWIDSPDILKLFKVPFNLLNRIIQAG